jgi:glycosyltransferase involved in cell wall biosynthesis
MNKPVLLAIGSSEVGGGQKVFLLMVTELTNRGIDVIVVLPAGPLVDLLKDVAAKLYIIEYNLKSIPKLIKIIKGNDVGLINTFLTKCSLYFLMANLYYRVPICCTLLNAIIHEKLTPLQRVIYPFLYRTIEKLSDGIIVNSYQNKKHFIEVGGMDESAVDVIYSGVDFPLLETTKEPSTFEKKRLVIGAIGRLAPEKGHKYLLEALTYIEDIDYDCWIVGDGPLRLELEEYVSHNGLTGRVKFWGFREDVPKILEDISMVVMPSLDETFGLTIVEAFGQKKIVIATNVGGIPEIVQHGVTGLLVSSRDAKGIAKMIRFCLSHLEAVHEMIENAFTLAHGKFTTNAMVDNTVIYYNNLLDKQTIKRDTIPRG